MSNHWLFECYMVRMTIKCLSMLLSMNPLSFLCYSSVHHECIAHMYAFIECFLLPQEVCSHCLYWEWLKVRSVDVPKYTLYVY